MIKLIPINQDDFDIFLEHQIASYAEDKVRSGNWEAEGALERSRTEIQRYLPDGPHSKDQFIFTIFDNEQNLKLSVLWVEIKMDAPNRPAFIYEFIIEEPYRGKGFGKKTLMALDEKLQQMGAKTVGLHVFGHNTIAFDLYKKMGYEVTNISMK